MHVIVKPYKGKEIVDPTLINVGIVIMNSSQDDSQAKDKINSNLDKNQSLADPKVRQCDSQEGTLLLCEHRVESG